MSSELQVATTRVIATLTAAMTPQQLRGVARELRTLDGDPIDVRFFADVAAGLDKYAGETEQAPA
jgi:hypothetical protein